MVCVFNALKGYWIILLPSCKCEDIDVCKVVDNFGSLTTHRWMKRLTNLSWVGSVLILTTDTKICPEKVEKWTKWKLSPWLPGSETSATEPLRLSKLASGLKGKQKTYCIQQLILWRCETQRFLYITQNHSSPCLP